MPDRTIAIAPVRLARSWRRLLAPSFLLLLVATVAGAAGWVLGGMMGVGLAVAAGIVALLALYLALMVVRVRLEVEVATLHLRWPGGDRSYALARGPVTRVTTRGEGAARLRARFGAFGWAIGPARLRDTERIEVIRLAPTDTLILVPTEQGRLGIAAASESELIAALGAAARVQQRLDAATSQVRVTAAPLLRRSSRPALPVPPGAKPPPDPRYMTGIQRAQLERRLAAERAAALAAAEAERTSAGRAAMPAATEASPATQAVTTAREAERRAGRRRALPRPSLRGTALRAAPLAVAAVPALAAGAMWLLAGNVDLLPTGSALRSMALATALAAAGLLGGLIAVRWFPRLVGLVTLTSLVALVLIGRALFA